MQFKRIEDVQEFITWCRGQKIQEVSAGGVTVRFSALAFVDAPTKRVSSAAAVDDDIDPTTGYTKDELFGPLGR